MTRSCEKEGQERLGIKSHKGDFTRETSRQEGPDLLRGEVRVPHTQHQNVAHGLGLVCGLVQEGRVEHEHLPWFSVQRVGVSDGFRL
jgi:hypothetical protein